VKQILFVDDEPNVLDGLRVLLRKYRHEWSMEFALGGPQALALLADRAFDVVVTDLRMPGVDGLTLLKHLREHHPQTIRIVLSGDPERTTALAAVPHAHQSLTKPCRAGEIEGVLARASVLGALIGDPEVRAAIGRLDELPSLPATYARLVRVFEDEQSCTADVAEVVGSDLAVTAKVLQLANSAFFGSGRQVTSVAQAIPLMGWETVKTVTLTTELFAARGMPATIRKFAGALHEHSSVVALLASALVDEPDRSEAFAAGMLTRCRSARARLHRAGRDEDHGRGRHAADHPCQGGCVPARALGPATRRHRGRGAAPWSGVAGVVVARRGGGGARGAHRRGDNGGSLPDRRGGRRDAACRPAACSRAEQRVVVKVGGDSR